MLCCLINWVQTLETYKGLPVMSTLPLVIVPISRCGGSNLILKFLIYLSLFIMEGRGLLLLMVFVRVVLLLVFFDLVLPIFIAILLGQVLLQF